MNLGSKLVTAGLLVAVGTELVHDVLNAHFRPFEGPVDTAMHAIGAVSPIPILASGLLLASAAVARVRAGSRVLRVVPFLLLLALEGVLMHL